MKEKISVIDIAAAIALLSEVEASEIIASIKFKERK
jgi:hypothetical protein